MKGVEGVMDEGRRPLDGRDATAKPHVRVSVDRETLNGIDVFRVKAGKWMRGEREQRTAPLGRLG